MDLDDMQPILLLTRPKRQSKRFQAACAEGLGRRPQSLIAPLMEIQPRLQFVLPPDDETLIVTSENALDALFQRADLTGRRAICVGETTTKSALGYGLAARFGGRTAQELVSQTLMADEGNKYGHVRGAFTTGDIVGQLRAAGREASDYIVYDQVARPLSDGARTILSLNRKVVLPLFSARSAALFFDASPNTAAKLTVIAISSAVADRVPDHVNVIMAEAPSGAEMIKCVVASLKED